jgi:dihydropteroate synthase
MDGKRLYNLIKTPPTKVMGILNVTPDSFYDGGRYLDQKSAFERIRQVVSDGASIIDVGAESTRPGSDGVNADEEIKRLFPALEIVRRFDIPVSLDTSKPEVAKKFLELGWVDMINDVTGLKNKEMIKVVKEYDVPCVVMHMFGEPRNMQKIYDYKDVVEDIKTFFKKKLSGIKHDKIIIDPGIGFGKSVSHNLEILKRLNEFSKFNVPVMVGISRKSFIGKVLNLDASERLEGSLGALAIAIIKGASLVRVHDVKESVRVIRIAEAIRDVDYKEIQV